MEEKKVKDLMIKLDDYAVVDIDATLRDAILALEEAQKKIEPDRQPHRAVLVVNKNKRIVGKVGHLAFLKALEPKYEVIKDIDKLSRAGVSDEFISTMMDHYKLFRADFQDLCRKAMGIKVMDVMHSVGESVDEEAPLAEALNQLIVQQTLSILVTRDGKVVGLLRLSDIFDEISGCIKNISD
ncbi:MAG: CBS domain-containing protein [Candidatus Zixiibacteriota bacterium]|nr:MAG: CBS domain-containing protein [candidate division Zixibacteria bacterium]